MRTGNDVLCLGQFRVSVKFQYQGAKDAADLESALDPRRRCSYTQDTFLAH
jgi:hypothetical protein